MLFCAITPGEQSHGFNSAASLQTWLNKTGRVIVEVSTPTASGSRVDVVTALARDIQPALFEVGELDPLSVGALF